MNETAKYEPSDAAYEMLRMDLGFMKPSETQVEYLKRKLSEAAGQIQKRNVKLTKGDIQDDCFVASWAAWLYRKRDSGAALPLMLREELYTRLVGQSTKRASG